MLNRKNILDLHYQEDAQGNALLYAASSPYTGIVLETLPSGYITAAYEVKAGLKDGVEQEFYAVGEVEHLAHYWKGLLHGDVVYYYPEGGLKEKSVFEYGICLEEFQWDETGALTHHRIVELLAYQQVILEKSRREFGK